MSVENQGINSPTALTSPLTKRKRGRPRKDEVLFHQGSASDRPSESDRPRRRRRKADSSSSADAMIGQAVSGILDGSFDAGYLLTVKVGSSGPVLRGVVFEPSLSLPVSPGIDVAPHVKMFQRAERPSKSVHTTPPSQNVHARPVIHANHAADAPHVAANNFKVHLVASQETQSQSASWPNEPVRDNSSPASGKEMLGDSRSAIPIFPFSVPSAAPPVNPNVPAPESAPSSQQDNKSEGTEIPDKKEPCTPLSLQDRSNKTAVIALVTPALQARDTSVDVGINTAEQIPPSTVAEMGKLNAVTHQFDDESSGSAKNEAVPMEVEHTEDSVEDLKGSMAVTGDQVYDAKFQQSEKHSEETSGTLAINQPSVVHSDDRHADAETEEVKPVEEPSKLPKTVGIDLSLPPSAEQSVISETGCSQPVDKKSNEVCEDQVGEGIASQDLSSMTSMDESSTSKDASLASKDQMSQVPDGERPAVSGGQIVSTEPEGNANAALDPLPETVMEISEEKSQREDYGDRTDVMKPTENPVDVLGKTCEVSQDVTLSGGPDSTMDALETGNLGSWEDVVVEPGQQGGGDRPSNHE